MYNSFPTVYRHCFLINKPDYIFSRIWTKTLKDDIESFSYHWFQSHTGIIILFKATLCAYKLESAEVMARRIPDMIKRVNVRCKLVDLPHLTLNYQASNKQVGRLSNCKFCVMISKDCNSKSGCCNQVCYVQLTKNNMCAKKIYKKSSDCFHKETLLYTFFCLDRYSRYQKLSSYQRFKCQYMWRKIRKWGLRVFLVRLIFYRLGFSFSHTHSSKFMTEDPRLLVISGPLP